MGKQGIPVSEPLTTSARLRGIGLSGYVPAVSILQFLFVAITNVTFRHLNLKSWKGSLQKGTQNGRL